MKHLFIIIALFVGNIFSQEVSEFEFRKKMEEYLAKERESEGERGQNREGQTARRRRLTMSVSTITMSS